MGKIRSGIFAMGRAVAYPFVKPVRDLVGSARAVRNAAASAREVRRQRERANQRVDERLQGLSPAAKFERMVVEGGWKEGELVQQQVAVRRARLSALATGVAGFAICAVLMAYVPGWPRVALAVVAMVLLVATGVQALRMAWWEHSLRTRTLESLRSFLARPDLLQLLLTSR
jgi:hypothetical protein